MAKLEKTSRSQNINKDKPKNRKKNTIKDKIANIVKDKNIKEKDHQKAF